MENTIFNYVDSILYKKDLPNNSINHSQSYAPYLVNRWLSMYSADVANIVNSTVNVYGDVFTKEEHFKFIKNLVNKSPKKKIAYIKKKKVEEVSEEILETAEYMELSKREVKEMIDLQNFLDK